MNDMGASVESISKSIILKTSCRHRFFVAVDLEIALRIRPRRDENNVKRAGKVRLNENGV